MRQTHRTSQRKGAQDAAIDGRERMSASVEYAVPALRNRMATATEIRSVQSNATNSGTVTKEIAMNTHETTSMHAPKRLARLAGLLYLFVGIFGGFAEGYVYPKMYSAGNAAATAGNVVANAGLVRLDVVAHLLDGTFFILLAMTLYILLKHVHKSMARAFVLLVALATGIICLNAVFMFEGLRVATDSTYTAAFGTAGSNALVLLLLDTQHYGTLIAQVFFGLWLVPLGYLAYRSSGMFPKWLGVLLVVGGVGYLVDLLTAFLVPDVGTAIHPFVGVIPTALAEITMLVYLLVVGVKTVKPTDERLIP